MDPQRFQLISQSKHLILGVTHMGRTACESAAEQPATSPVIVADGTSATSFRTSLGPHRANICSQNTSNPRSGLRRVRSSMLQPKLNISSFEHLTTRRLETIGVSACGPPGLEKLRKPASPSSTRSYAACTGHSASQCGSPTKQKKHTCVASCDTHDYGTALP